MSTLVTTVYTSLCNSISTQFNWITNSQYPKSQRLPNLTIQLSSWKASHLYYNWLSIGVIWLGHRTMYRFRVGWVKLWATSLERMMSRKSSARSSLTIWGAATNSQWRLKMRCLCRKGPKPRKNLTIFRSKLFSKRTIWNWTFAFKMWILSRCLHKAYSR